MRIYLHDERTYNAHKYFSSTNTRTIDVSVAAHKLLVSSIVIDSTYFGQLNGAWVASSVELLGTCDANRTLDRDSCRVGKISSLVERQVRQCDSAIGTWIPITSKSEDHVVRPR